MSKADLVKTGNYRWSRGACGGCSHRRVALAAIRLYPMFRPAVGGCPGRSRHAAGCSYARRPPLTVDLRPIGWSCVDRRKSVPNARVNVSIRDLTPARRFRSQGSARPAAGCEAKVSIAQPCRCQRSKSVNGVVADEGAFTRSPSGLATPARDRLPQISRWRPRCEATARA